MNPVQGPNPYSFIEDVDENTTVEQFQSECKLYPNYTLTDCSESGWTVLGSASIKGNLRLVSFILDQTLDRPIVNKEFSAFGWTPLFCASLCEDKTNATQIAIRLLNAGSTPNKATISDCEEDLPANVMPLWAAAKINNPLLINLLLNRGAEEKSIVPYDEDQRNAIFSAKVINIAFKVACNKNPDNIFSSLPVEIIRECLQKLIDLKA
jgi:hypothetical protein